MIPETAMSIPQAFALLFVAFIAYYVGSAIYCIFFHPLSKYPGPFLAKFSGLPSFYYTYKGDRHVWLWQCHEIYGDTIRSSYDTLMFSDPDTFREIYGANSNVQKSWHYGIWPKDATAVSTFTCRDPKTHRRRRRNLDCALSERAVRSAELFIAQHSDRWGSLLVEGAENGWSEPRNMTEWSDSLFFDIFCDLCFGWTYETKKPGPNRLRAVPHDVAGFMIFAYRIFYSPFVGIWLFMKPRGLDKLFSILTPPAVQYFQDFVAENLNERLKKEALNEKTGTAQDREDMLHFLIKAKDVETGKPAYDAIDLCEETNMLTAAGADTTSGVITALFFYLIHDPEVLEKLNTEIRTTFPSLSDVKSGQLLTSCVYLQACIDEALRMNPHGGSESRRVVLPGGLRVKQELLPPGTIVGGGIFAMHHNIKIFPDPFRFRPERWIVGNSVTAEGIKACHRSIFAFSYGPRACPGKALARLEMAVSMARLIFQYNLRNAPGSTEGQGRSDMMWGRRDKTQFQSWDYMIAVKNGPMVQFKKRANIP